MISKKSRKKDIFKAGAYTEDFLEAVIEALEQDGFYFQAWQLELDAPRGKLITGDAVKKVYGDGWSDEWTGKVGGFQIVLCVAGD